MVTKVFKMKLFLYLLLSIPFSAWITACSTNQPVNVPTETAITIPPQPTETPIHTLTPIISAVEPENSENPFIIEVSSYGANDRTVVSGLIWNVSNTNYQELSIDINLFDSSGQNLQSSTIQPVLSMIPAGESVPFTTTFETSYDPSTSIVTTVARSTPVDEQKAFLLVEKTRSFLHTDGSVALTGQVRNEQDVPVFIQNLVVVFWNTAGQIINISNQAIYAHYLDPYESTPFKITIGNLELPMDAEFDYLVFWDAQETAFFPVYDLVITDDAQTGILPIGNFNLVVELTNHELVPMNTTIVAGLYNLEGYVLDVTDTEANSIQLSPNESRIIDLRNWSNLGSTPAIVDELATYSVQWDPSRTKPQE